MAQFKQFISYASVQLVVFPFFPASALASKGFVCYVVFYVYKSAMFGYLITQDFVLTSKIFAMNYLSNKELQNTLYIFIKNQWSCLLDVTYEVKNNVHVIIRRYLVSR